MGDVKLGPRARVSSVAGAMNTLLALIVVLGLATLGAPQATPAAPASAAVDARVREPEEVAAAKHYFLMARESERVGDLAAALSWYSMAFRHDAQSRDLCFIYLERLKDAGAVDSANVTARQCQALAGDTARGAPLARRKPLTLSEHKLLGEVALRAEDVALALTHYQAAYRLDENDGDVLYVLAGLYEEAGDWEGHAETVRRLLPRLGYPARLIERLARAYGRLDRPEAIIPILEEAWETTRTPMFGLTLAAHYESVGRNLSLLKTARQLAALRPADDLEADALLARAYVLADRPDSALIVAARLRAANPDDVGLRVMQASLLFERGRYKEARPLAVELAKDAPEVAAHHLLEGSVLLELSAKPKVVRAALDRALTLAPLSPDVRARRAYATYVWGGAPDSLTVDGVLAIEVGSSRSASSISGMTVNEALGDSVSDERRALLEGLAHARLAQDLLPREPGQRPAVYSDSSAARRHRLIALGRYEAILSKNSGHRAALFEAGALSERLGDFERSKSLLRRLVARDTLHATAMNYLAYTIIEQDSITPLEREESRQMLTRALKLDPENGAFMDSWGWWHFKNGEPDSALVWLNAAYEAVPGDPAVLDHILQAQIVAGQPTEACQTARRLQAIDPRYPANKVCDGSPTKSAVKHATGSTR